MLARAADQGQLAKCHSIGSIPSDPVPIMTSVQTNHTNSMRKIETLMNVAISNNHEYWSKANTSVETIDGVSYVRLHGNLIAEVDDNGIKLYDGGWQSNTTKSRLNAILTCLLYTSPSPRDQRGSRMPSSA